MYKAWFVLLFVSVSVSQGPLSSFALFNQPQSTPNNALDQSVLYSQSIEDFRQNYQSKQTWSNVYSVFQWTLGLMALTALAGGVYFDMQVQNDLKRQQTIRDSYLSLEQGTDFSRQKADWQMYEPRIDENVAKANLFYYTSLGMALAWSVTYVF